DLIRVGEREILARKEHVDHRPSRAAELDAHVRDGVRRVLVARLEVAQVDGRSSKMCARRLDVAELKYIERRVAEREGAIADGIPEQAADLVIEPPDACDRELGERREIREIERVAHDVDLELVVEPEVHAPIHARRAKGRVKSLEFE